MGDYTILVVYCAATYLIAFIIYGMAVSADNKVGRDEILLAAFAPVVLPVIVVMTILVATFE